MFSQTASTVRYVTGQLHTDNEPPAHQATHSLTLPSKVSLNQVSVRLEAFDPENEISTLL
ncbi:hypothetical protein EYF80_016269 [Liparis tanakae]|uniref:Uncharacterized protein n=1 Tax=Liparis tanakae TaxID=230148 RepID=A0A4Z2I604_9TELE|nr:hypothetical protein EYF80_016269 [Liparis tanakae]